MEVSVQLHAPDALPRGKSWVGPRVGMDAVEKRKIGGGGRHDTEFEIKGTGKGKGGAGERT
jgi:hypothetical protein